MNRRLTTFRAALRLLCLAIAPLVGLPALAQTPRATTGDYIVAVVNSESVTAVEVQQRVDRARIEARRTGTALPDDDSLRKQAMEALIEERVIVTFARETAAKVDDMELERAVGNVAAQNQLSVPQLRERLKADGLDWMRFRGNLKDQILAERVREREVNSRIKVTDADIDKVLDDMRASASADAELSLAQILIPVPEGAAEALLAQKRDEAARALARVRGGENFAAVAREMSADPNREAGGAIGARPASRLPDLFVDAVRDLQPGQFTPAPVRSGAGFHVIKLLDRKTSGLGRVTQTRARHILLRTSEQSPQAATVRRMEDLRRQIERGDRTFEAIAREVSEDGSAAGGGDLGWASPGQFVPEFEEAMNKLPLLGLSVPVVTRFGVHLIQVVERRETTLELKELREQVRNQLREQKYGQAYEDWTKELRLRSYVEYREPPQ